MTRLSCILLLLAVSTLSVMAGETQESVPEAEFKALERAINREVSRQNADTQLIGELMKLRNRLHQMRTSGRAPKDVAVEPLAADDAQVRLLRRLETDAANGGRAAKRSLALYYMFLNEPEKALQQWRLMGRATDYDAAYNIISAYLELALGEYNTGRASLDAAVRLMETRTSLTVSAPVFCQTIAGYRLYVPMEKRDFLPGDDVLVYVEIEGVEFKRLVENEYECSLMFGLKLLDDNQRTIWQESNYGEYAPLFSGPIRDLHAALTWRIPNHLEAGRYHLFVEAIEDSSKRRGESVLGFNVAKRPTNPEKRPSAGILPGNTEQTLQNNEGLYQKILRDAQRQVPGALLNEPNGMRPDDPNFGRSYELQRDYVRGQRAD